jgi:DNA-binding beta-propeller fold protein YncE
MSWLTVSRFGANLWRAWRSLPAKLGLPTRRLVLEVLEGRLCPSGGYLLVSSFDTDSVLRYDETTGAFAGAFVPTKSGGLRQPMGVAFGPDHNLYVASGLEADQGTGHRDVLRYNGTTGAFIDDFADQNQLQSPRGILFGPDGNLYVADGFADAVVRYNGTTGAFMDNFVPPGSGGLSHPGGMVFGPDGSSDGKLDLYVGNNFDHKILRYDGTTGAFKGIFASSGALNTVTGLAFGPDGNLYVANANFTNSGTFPAGNIVRFEGPGGPSPGALLGTFVSAGSGGLSTPDAGLLFGPDGSNDGKLDLYVASAVASFGAADGKVQFVAAPGTSEVLRYDGTTGAFKGAFAAGDSGGLEFPTFMTFTETNPTTLNYEGLVPATTSSPGPALALAQPATDGPTSSSTSAAPPLLIPALNCPTNMLAFPAQAAPPAGTTGGPILLSSPTFPGSFPPPPAAENDSTAPVRLPGRRAGVSAALLDQAGGGGAYFAVGGIVCLDVFTTLNLFGNTASTSDKDIHGPYTTCP